MSEDRINKDPLLGGLDGMRAGQHWEGEPESLRHPEKPDQAQEAFSAEKVQSAEEEARKIAPRFSTGPKSRMYSSPPSFRPTESSRNREHENFSGQTIHQSMRSRTMIPPIPTIHSA